MQDVNSALPPFRVFNDPMRRPPCSVRPDPRIKDEVRNRYDSSRPDRFSNASSNEPEWRTKPTNRAGGFAERCTDGLVAQTEIMIEPFEVPQIGEPMVKRVINNKVAGTCDSASLFWPGHNLTTNQTEASFNTEFVQDRKQVIGNHPCRTIVKSQHAVARRQSALLAGNKDGTDRHAQTQALENQSLSPR